MKKVKLKLSKIQMEALIFCVNQSGLFLNSVSDLQLLALKELYTKLFIKLQVRMLNLKLKNNSLKLSLTECWAIDSMRSWGFTGFELSTLKAICREIDKQIISL